ncbi:hypothetical protein ACTFIV_009776 [Dictyostelium citrinum]
MKQIISLILLLSLTFSNINAFLIEEDSIKNEGVSEQVCFLSGSIGIDGFYANTIGVGDNAYFRTTVGDEQLSFFEQSNLDVDFLNQRSYIYYVLTNNGESKYVRSWSFTSNKTEYFATAVNNVPTCFISTMDYEISSNFKLVYSTDCKIGTVPCEEFSIYSSQTLNFTSNSIWVNKDDCSFMTSISRSFPPATLGMSMTNFLNFVPNASNPYDFVLPSICLNPTPINKNMASSLRSKLLNLFSKSF